MTVAPITHEPAPKRWHPAHFLHGGYAHFVLLTAIRRDGGREVAEFVLNTASLHLCLGPAIPEDLRAIWLAQGGWVHAWLNCPDSAALGLGDCPCADHPMFDWEYLGATALAGLLNEVYKRRYKAKGAEIVLDRAALPPARSWAELATDRA